MYKSTRIIWYKRLSVQGRGNRAGTLQEMLKTALARLAKRPAERLYRPDPDQPDSVGINAFHSVGDALVGQFLSFEAGRQQPTIRLSGAGAAFDITAIKANAAGEDQREFLDGICYFLVWKDHLAFIQSKSLASRDFEKYLNWLLGRATSGLQDGQSVVVSDMPPSKTLAKVADRHIRGVTFGAPVFSASEAKGVHRSTSFTIDNRLIEGLRAFLPELGRAQGLRDILSDPSVFVTVTVRVKRSQGVGNEAKKLLRSVVDAARHSHPDDLSIEVSGIGELKGDELKVFRRISVTLLESGGLVDEKALWKQMSSWLKKMIDDKVIPS